MAAADENLWVPETLTWHRQMAQRRQRRIATEQFLFPLPVEHSKLLAQRVVFAQQLKPQTIAVASGILNSQPLTYARAPDGNVYWANGLGPVMKFDGILVVAQSAGVPAPATALTLAATGSGGSITGSYTAYQRFLDKDGRPGNLSPISNTVTASAATGWSYSSVPAPTSAKVTRRQILRNTAGQALTYYVDVDTTDLTATTFTSTRTDAQLAVQTAVPLFDVDGRSLANRYAVPRDDKPIIALYQDRMFLAGDVSYGEGNVEVTVGSTTVTGVGTAWNTSLQTRYLYVVGHDQPYQISTVDATNQTLTLASPYLGATDKFAVYSIRTAPAERRNLMFTEAGQYEAWPAVNAITLPENGDETTGLMAADSFLFVLQRRHIFRLTYRRGPAIDGGLFLSAHRGCINHRCWIYLDGAAYMLDEQGIYRFRGADDAEQLSGPIQDLWWVDAPDNEFTINWDAQRWFHAVHTRDESIIRWFVALSGSRLPRHAICFNYVTQTFWLEEYAFGLGCSVLAETDQPRPLVGGPARRIFSQGIGTLDGPDPDAGTTRSTATAATVLGLTDALASFATVGLVGSPIAIVAGRGKGQVNVIAAVSGTTLTLVRPWLIKPDTTSKYQLGAISWRWTSHWMRWVPLEGDQQRRIEVLFQPVGSAAQMDIRLYRDHAATPEDWGETWPKTTAESDGVTTTKDDPDAEIDLNRAEGFAHLRVSGRRERYLQKADLVALELRGFSAENPVTVSEITVEAAE